MSSPSNAQLTSMRYLYCFFVVLTIVFGCNQCRENGYNVYLLEDGDTTKYFYFSISQEYQLYRKDQVDELLSAESQRRVRGEFLIGLTDTKARNSRCLIFRAEQGTSFKDYSDPLANFLGEELKLKDYRLSVADNFQDSTILPISQHHILSLVDFYSNDTILFQETAYAINGERMSFALLTYEHQTQRDEMEAIINDLTEKLDE